MQDELSQMFGRVVDLQTRASRHFRDAVLNQHVAA
jgi:predicted nucleotidyltransferase